MAVAHAVHPDSPALASTARLRVGLLRGFRVTSDGEPLVLPLNAQRLVAYLALQDRPQSRICVAATLWMDSSEDRSNASLRSTLWRIGLVSPQLVQATRAQLGLGPEVTTDIGDAATLARHVLATPLVAELSEAQLQLLLGDLLPGWYDDWVALERERLRQLSLHALEALCAGLTEAGRFGQAVEVGLAAVQGEPLRDTAHRALIAAYLAEGNRIEALRQYRTYECLLRRELGLPPSPQMVELVRDLIR